MDKLITALGVLTLLSSTHVLGAESTTPPGQTTTVVNGPNNPVPMGMLGSGGTLVPISPTTPIPIGTLGADGSIKPVSPTAPIPMGTVGANGSVVPVSSTTPIPVTVTTTSTNPVIVTGSDFTDVVSSGRVPAGNGVTELFRGNLARYKTVKLITKCVGGGCLFLTMRVSEEFDGESLLIDAFAPPRGTALADVRFYDLPGPSFVVQGFVGAPDNDVIHFVLLGRRN